jgi:hypothetical protein
MTLCCKLSREWKRVAEPFLSDAFPRWKKIELFSRFKVRQSVIPVPVLFWVLFISVHTGICLRNLRLLKCDGHVQKFCIGWQYFVEKFKNVTIPYRLFAQCTGQYNKIGVITVFDTVLHVHYSAQQS